MKKKCTKITTKAKLHLHTCSYTSQDQIKGKIIMLENSNQNILNSYLSQAMTFQIPTLVEFKAVKKIAKWQLNEKIAVIRISENDLSAARTASLPATLRTLLD